MQAIGYPATWPTTCFIEGGCGSSVFAHTNGYGDFVLFDRLGLPWQVHECYAERFFLGGAVGRHQLAVRSDRATEYRAVSLSGTPARRPTPPDIEKVDPGSLLGAVEFSVVGTIQDYVERQADRLIREAGRLGQLVAEKTFGKRRSQLTLVTSDLKSYTVFADLSQVVVARKDSVLATIRAEPILGLPGRSSIFVAADVIVIHGLGE